MNRFHILGNTLYVISKIDEYPRKEGMSLNVLNQPPFIPAIPVIIIPIPAAKNKDLNSATLL